MFFVQDPNSIDEPYVGVNNGPFEGDFSDYYDDLGMSNIYFWFWFSYVSIYLEYISIYILGYLSDWTFIIEGNGPPHHSDEFHTIEHNLNFILMDMHSMSSKNAEMKNTIMDLNFKPVRNLIKFSDSYIGCN